MDFEKFKKQFDDYMATPQAQIDIDNMMSRLEEKQIEYRTVERIPLGFSYAQEDALMALRDLSPDNASGVIDLYLNQMKEKNQSGDIDY